MTHGDVTTRSNRGQWENVVEGMPERSASYRSREEAVAAGEAVARLLGGRHVVVDATPTGAIVDPDEASGDDVR